MRSGNNRCDSVCIKSTGSYVPARILTNEEVVANLPTSPEWIVETLGVRERRIAEPEEYTSDLAARAGLEAIASAGLEPNEIDLIIVATATPDRKAPSSACIAQAKMGISNCCAAFDVAAVCSGFVYGMTIAGQFIQNGTYERACAGDRRRYLLQSHGLETPQLCLSWRWRRRRGTQEESPGEWALSKHALGPGRGNGSFHDLSWGRLLHNERKGSLRERYNRASRVYSADSLFEPARTRRCHDDLSAPGLGANPQARGRGTQCPFLPNADEPGVAREHRGGLSPVGPGPGKPARSHPRRRSSPVRGHRRRLDLGRKLISMVSSPPEGGGAASR